MSTLGHKEQHQEKTYHLLNTVKNKKRANCANNAMIMYFGTWNFQRSGSLF